MISFFRSTHLGFMSKYVDENGQHFKEEKVDQTVIRGNPGYEAQRDYYHKYSNRSSAAEMPFYMRLLEPPPSFYKKDYPAAEGDSNKNDKYLAPDVYIAQKIGYLEVNVSTEFKIISFSLNELFSFHFWTEILPEEREIGRLSQRNCWNEIWWTTKFTLFSDRFSTNYVWKEVWRTNTSAKALITSNSDS